MPSPTDEPLAIDLCDSDDDTSHVSASDMICDSDWRERISLAMARKFDVKVKTEKPPHAASPYSNVEGKSSTDAARVTPGDSANKRFSAAAAIAGYSSSEELINMAAPTSGPRTDPVRSDCISDDTLAKLLTTSLFTVPFASDKNSDDRASNIEEYYKLLADEWPWLQTAYVAASSTGGEYEQQLVHISLPTSGVDGLPKDFPTLSLLENKYVALAGYCLSRLYSLTLPQLSKFAEAFNVPTIFREALDEMLPSIDCADKTYALLCGKHQKQTDKIVTRTKDAMRAKIRLARDFSRCRVGGVILRYICEYNHRLLSTQPSDCVIVPALWAESTILSVKYSDGVLEHLPNECSRPELHHQGYHSYLLLIVEQSLRTCAANAAHGNTKKRARTTNSAQTAFEKELSKSPMKYTDRNNRTKSYTSRAFLNINTVDASKLERLKSTDMQPTFETMSREICSTYEILSVATQRMKALTNLALQMNTAVTEGTEVMEKAESAKKPRGRRALVSENFINKNYFDATMQQVNERFRLLDKDKKGVEEDTHDQSGGESDDSKK